MQVFTIHLDGLAYKGESPEETEPNQPGIGTLFNVGPLGKLVIEEGEPIEIVSVINLKSHLDRITQRMRNGTITCSQIVIDIQERKF